MLDRRHRFHGLGSLNHVYKHGSTRRTPWFAIKYQRNPKRSTYRCAVVVSRKVSKSAVVRNRIRRRLYELLRLELAGLVPAYDIVVTVFSDQVESADSKKLQRMVHEAVAAAGLR